MTKPKLTYFDMHGGRGEPVRLAFHIAGQEFEDERLGFQEFAQRRQELPFQAVPALEMDGEVLTQTNAMLRYVGQQCELYPQDAMEAFRCDEMLGAAEDLSNSFVATMGLKGEALKQGREQLIEQKWKPMLQGIEAKIARTEGSFLAGQQMSVADLRLFVWGKAIQKGIMDHVPTDLIEQQAPQFAQLVQAVEQHPKVQEYYAQQQQQQQ